MGGAPPMADALLPPTVLQCQANSLRIGSASTPILPVDRIQNLGCLLPYRQALAHLDYVTLGNPDWARHAEQ